MEDELVHCASQVLTVLCWLVTVLSILPMAWLIFQPYFKRWSCVERRVTDLLRDTLTPEQFHQLLWRGYLEISSPSESQRVYRLTLLHLRYLLFAQFHDGRSA